MFSILFVSHDADLRAAASRVLRAAGGQVAAVAHGGHAVLACACGRRFDVLVVDERDGRETAAVLERRLRRDCPDVATVCLRDQRGAAADGRITIVRPFTAGDLIDAVRSAAATPSPAA
jgi:CheY-like chemotaxis protein